MNLAEHELTATWRSSSDVWINTDLPIRVEDSPAGPINMPDTETSRVDRNDRVIRFEPVA